MNFVLWSFQECNSEDGILVLTDCAKVRNMGKWNYFLKKFTLYYTLKYSNEYNHNSISIIIESSTVLQNQKYTLQSKEMFYLHENHKTQSADQESNELSIN